ncbi:hypothetical protein BST81_17335 [Leptolyngbya sp. 'hensonii']|uniref:hypothetical protein n=1 Tax=Leptolyngbya sp. 'hensonii' TaxID=1922337 RepID=UPI0009502DD0|nr:hypothetical protein [Leptolyngbya sp. 'hensonii']OLP17119.1 hypothetical protein BST81_17335 [Leptolyngbya sp. 'hensonii']
MDTEKTELVVCIGTFDSSGLPITIAKHLADYATVTFQALSLNMLVSRSLALGPMRTTYIRNKDGSVIRVERTARGFTAYLEEPETRLTVIHKQPLSFQKPDAA